MQTIPVERWGGLNLSVDSGQVGWSGAVDMLNIDIEGQSQARARAGYDNFTAVAEAARIDCVVPARIGNTDYVLAGQVSGGKLVAYTDAGVVVTSVASTGASPQFFADAGTTAAEFVYIANGTDTVRRFTGVAFATPAYTGTTPTGYYLAYWGNRLVNARLGSNPHRVLFSNAGDALTFGATDFVDLDPGDGEFIAGMIAWAELLFVFKQTKYYVFHSTSTDATGGAIFNYRRVDAGVGLRPSSRALAASRDGVYFLDGSGVYRTAGDRPQLVSRALDAFFNGTSPSSFTSGNFNHGAAPQIPAMTWHRERLYLAVPTGSATANDRMFVYDPRDETWLLWNIPATSLVSWRKNLAVSELLFGYASGLNHIGRHSGTYTDDDGTAIASHYQSGRQQLARGQQADVRDFDLYGTGTVTLALAADGGAVNATANGDGTVGGAVSTVLATGVNPVNVGALCRDLSFKLSATSGAWSVDRLAARVQGGRDWT